MNEFYDGTKLLSLRDLNGLKPEIYLCVGNRTAGKTYFMKRMLVRKFLKRGEKFCVLVKFNYELDGIADSFFKDISHEFTDKIMTSCNVGKGLYTELYLDDLHCGYCVALNSSDTIKKYSSRFVDVASIFYDEFESESGKGVPDELNKFMSIHISMARGNGQHVRYLPVYMCANAVSVMNRYFIAFDINKRLRPNTKFLRGDGWVLEQTLNYSASKALSGSAFGRAFAKEGYMKFASDNKSLLDYENYVTEIKGNGRLLCNIKSDDNIFGVWRYDNVPIVYISSKYDPSNKITIALKTKDHNYGTVTARGVKDIIKYLGRCYDLGDVRFNNVQCRNVFMDVVGLLNK